jgi:hypothetical protein
LEALEQRDVPAVIGGTVYADLNANGLFNPGETPIANNTIQLYRTSTGQLLATTTTDANGQYRFTVDPTISTAPTTKEVDATFGPARTDLAQTQSVAQFNPALGTLTSVQIVSDAQLNTDVQAENLGNAPQNVQAQVQGTVTLQGPGGLSLTSNPATTLSDTLQASDGTVDLSGADSKDFGAQPIAAQTQSLVLNAATQDLSSWVGTGTVNLSETASATSNFSGSGNLAALVRTTAQGHVKVIYTYTPSTSFQPGLYTVVQPQEPPGYLDGADTADNVTPIPGSQHTDFIVVNLGTTDSLNNNFGEIPPGSLSGFAYYDRLGAHAYVPGDQPLANVAVSLSGVSIYGDPVSKTAQTAADGSYQFVNLYPGTYYITETQPAGYLQGTNTLGSLGGSVLGDQFTVGLPTGAAGVNYNFGEVLPAPTPPPAVVPTVPPVFTPPPATPAVPPVFALPPAGKIDLLSTDWSAWGW